MTHIIGKILSQRNLYENNALLSVAVIRRSGKTDIIPVRVSCDILIPNFDYTNRFVYVKGSFCSENIDGHLSLFVKADTVIMCDEHFHNSSNMSGTICKRPTYRLTPNGREISDILLAVNHDGTSSYIPCVCWENNAHYSAQLDVGDKVDVYGRIQSRNYIKDGADRIAYELSVDYITAN